MKLKVHIVKSDPLNDEEVYNVQGGLIVEDNLVTEASLPFKKLVGSRYCWTHLRCGLLANGYAIAEKVIDFKVSENAAERKGFCFSKSARYLNDIGL